MKVWKLTSSVSSSDSSALTEAQYPSSVDGTTINFSVFSWVVRPPAQDAHNQAKKARVSRAPEIKMGALFGRSPAGRQVLNIWALRVAPDGMSPRNPDISVDMRLLVVSDETVGSAMSEFHGCGIERPTCLTRSDGPDQCIHLRHPTLGGARVTDCLKQIVCPRQK